jgi:hypothetical protein
MNPTTEIHYTVTVLVKDTRDAKALEEIIAAAVEKIVPVLEDVHVEEEGVQER